MLAELSPSELGRWMALAYIEPWGALRDDLRAGYVAASLAPAWLKRKDGRGFKPADFMPDFARAAPKANPKALEKQFRAAFGSPPVSKAGNRK